MKALSAKRSLGKVYHHFEVYVHQIIQNCVVNDKFAGPEVRKTMTKFTNEFLDNSIYVRSIMLVPLFEYLPLESIRQHKQVYIEKNNMFKDIIRRKRKDPTPAGHEDEDMLDVLLRAQKDDKELTDKNVIGMLTNILQAGVDTIATATSWALGYLAKYPSYQEKIRAELDMFVGPDRLPTLEDLPNLKMLNACVRESIRIRSPSGIGGGHINLYKEVTIKGVTYPKDTAFFINLMGMMHNEKFWKYDPHKY